MPATGWPAWSLSLMSLAGLVVVGAVVYRRMVGPARRVAEVWERQQALNQQRAAQARAASDAATDRVPEL